MHGCSLEEGEEEEGQRQRERCVQGLVVQMDKRG